MDDLDRICVGLVLAWTVHDLEELATMPRGSRRALDRLPQWVSLPEGLRQRGLSRREVALAIGSVGAVMAGATLAGLRTRGRSPLFRGAVLAFGLHGMGHLAASLGARGYTTGVATVPVVVLPYWLHARRVLDRHGLSEGDGPAVAVALVGVPPDACCPPAQLLGAGEPGTGTPGARVPADVRRRAGSLTRRRMWLGAHGPGRSPAPCRSGPHAPNRADLRGRNERTSTPELSGPHGWN